MHKKTFYERFFKRPLDIVFSLLGLIVLSPVFLIIAVLVRIKLGSPVIFKQERPGKDEKIFKLYKFRSMKNAYDKEGKPLPDEERLTSFGKKLRSTSLDELPELWNILKGDMSFVGPRPLAISYLSYYTEQERHRHDVRSGLTGLAQINGRNNISWEDRFAYDIFYITHLTFFRDLKILMETIIVVFKRSDIVTRGCNNILDFDEYRKNQLMGKGDK